MSGEIHRPLGLKAISTGNLVMAKKFIAKFNKMSPISAALPIDIAKLTYVGRGYSLPGPSIHVSSSQHIG